MTYGNIDPDLIPLEDAAPVADDGAVDTLPVETQVSVKLDKSGLAFYAGQALAGYAVTGNPVGAAAAVGIGYVSESGAGLPLVEKLVDLAALPGRMAAKLVGGL